VLEGLITGFVASLSVCLVFYFIIQRKMNSFDLKQLLQDVLNDEEVQKQIALASDVFVEKLKMTVLGSIGGAASGVSRQLKGAEKEILAEGINQITGIPVGDIAAKYLQKYPALQMFLPMVLNQAKKMGVGEERLP